MGNTYHHRGEPVKHRGPYLPFRRVDRGYGQHVARVFRANSLPFHQVEPRIHRAQSQVHHGVVQERQVCDCKETCQSCMCKSSIGKGLIRTVQK